MILLLNVCIYCCSQEEECAPSSRGYNKIYAPGTITNSQKDKALTKINKNWCCCPVKNFSRTSDTIRHLQTFRVISKHYYFEIKIILR